MKTLIAAALAGLAILSAGCGNASPSVTPAAPIAQGVEQAVINDLARQASASVESYWESVLPKYYGTPYSPPKILGDYDNAPAECGSQSIGQDNAFYCTFDNTLAWDSSFLVAAANQGGAAAVAVVIAHEYGHSVQNNLGATPAVPDPDNTELNADCLAGAYFGEAVTQGVFTQSEAQDALSTLGLLADAYSGQGHGDAYSRESAFADGYNSGPTACITP